MNRASLRLAVLLSFVLACGDDDGTSVPLDSGTDAGFDAGGRDAGSDDASTDDAGPDDASTDDASTDDASTDDASTDDASTDDASTDDASTDDASTDDAGSDDAGSDDAGTDDAGTDDAGTDAGMDAGAMDDAGIGTRDAGPDACHSLDFGAAEVALRRVNTLPTMTGGTIPDGVYDAVEYQTTAGLMGAYRGTWNIRSTGAGVGTMDVIQQVTVTEPGPIVPRTHSWTASGNALARTETCPNEGAATNFTYSVVTEGGVTRLLARSNTLLFVLERR